MSKRLSLLAISILIVVGVSFSSAVDVHAYTINDKYWGADDHGLGDVIGSASIYSISSMEVYLTGGILQVYIHTDFAGYGDDGLYSNFTYDGNGIGYGDLFLSGSWNPDTSGSNYVNDDNVTGTLWSYGFALDDNWGNGGSGILYQLNGATNDDNAYLTNELLTPNGWYRNGQEVLVDENGQTFISNGTWTVDEANGVIGFQMDITGTALIGATDLAFHWGPTCANDVIEGSVNPVPEPSTLLLLGSGLVGIGIFFRRKNKEIG